MRLIFSEVSWSQYLFWQDCDEAMVERINELIKDTKRHPFTGLGKPEPLRGDMTCWWARRITREHKLVYRVTGASETQALEIAACRFHYER